LAENRTVIGQYSEEFDKKHRYKQTLLAVSAKMSVFSRNRKKNGVAERRAVDNHCRKLRLKKHANE